ncbi:MAG: type I methionyl aminopeptidase [Gammaproteobacteria bacterium]|nr:type I methionyl aminopeptidase [Gammaproteobacteria bacterium]
MMNNIKSQSDIKKMRVAGKLASEVIDMIGSHVKSGISTEELNEICHNYIIEVQQAVPAPLNYKGFPRSICTSVNHQVCHGIPSKDKILKNGDIINIDITVIKDGFHGDTSKMFLIGKPSVLANRLCRVAKECMYKAIEIVEPGLHIGDIGAVIQEHAHKNNFSVVREYCGHGIGKNFHESPQILHYGVKNTGIKLEEGMIFTIEPMINAGKKGIKVLNDGWTVVTQDKSLSAQWEHTILVTNNGYEILTKRTEEG